jgi:hypothetical protein
MLSTPASKIYKELKCWKSFHKDSFDTCRSYKAKKDFLVLDVHTSNEGVQYLILFANVYTYMHT